ncbi:MAG: hypothetical protein AB9866_07120 [Syntrophobacteraceae bacterium]
MKRADGASVATVNRYKVHLKTLLNHAVDFWGCKLAIPKITIEKETAKREMDLLPEDECENGSGLQYEN